MDLDLKLTEEQIKQLFKGFGDGTFVGKDMAVIPCERIAEKYSNFGQDFDDEDEEEFEYPIFEMILNLETTDEAGVYDVIFETNTDYDFEGNEISTIESVLKKEVLDELGLV